MDTRNEVSAVNVSIRGANGRMGLQAIYASMENNEAILERAKEGKISDKDVWIDIVFGAFTADISAVRQLLAGSIRSEKEKVLEGYDDDGKPVYKMKAETKPALKTRYVEQDLDEEPQRDHVIPLDRQEVIEIDGLRSIKILSKDKKEVLSTIRHINVRAMDLAGEEIMDKVLDTASGLGTNVLLSCVGDTAKKAQEMKVWLKRIHEKGHYFAFMESAPAKGWDARMLSRQDAISVLVTRNFSPTGTLFRTGLAIKQPLFDYNTFEFSKASTKFKKIMKRIIEDIISLNMFGRFAQFLEKTPDTIKETEGEPILVNFPSDFLTVISPEYLKFSFYEDNEYGYISAALIPNLKALGLVYKDPERVAQIRAKGVNYQSITNIPGIFGTTWLIKAPHEIISRGGAVSTSSCTTNGNIVGDFIMFIGLYCYYDFFYPKIRGYCLSIDEATDKHYEEIIEREFVEFKQYIKRLTKNRSHMIRSVFNFYYDNIEFIDTDMQHGLTRSESPDVIKFLRETSSGSQTEVPKILSLPDREIEYFRNLHSIIQDEYNNETDVEMKAHLQNSLTQVDATLKELEGSTNIVHILEDIEGK
ncbi:MAG: hypothetical protein U9P49_02465 [Thermodesulfobacteriota bacterium]|nr:hypothetical protein [Thermodesulfobacteriota bacterium]